MFDVTKLDGRRVIVRGAGVDHLVVADGAGSLRIDVSPGFAEVLSAGLEFRLLDTPALVFQLTALRRFISLRHKGWLAPGSMDVRLPRLVTALRTLDALADGASLRGMAATIFTEDDWPGAGDSTKSRVRRLIHLARRLKFAGASGVLAHAV